MDAMEYGLGLERGWLIDLLSKTSEYSDLIWDNSEFCDILCSSFFLSLTKTTVDSQIYEHLMWSRMALLPEPDVVTKVGNLFRRNFLECSMQERTHFLEVCCSLLKARSPDFANDRSCPSLNTRIRFFRYAYPDSFPSMPRTRTHNPSMSLSPSAPSSIPVS